jgi:hypothetical protein
MLLTRSAHIDLVAYYLVQAGPVIDAGGIFDYARKTGMIQAKAA